MYETCLEKQAKIKEKFKDCSTEEQKYEKLIFLGKTLPGISQEDKIAANLVSGCQSVMYIKSTCGDGKMHFTGNSDALISAGLAAILIAVYDGEEPETVLKCPPAFIEELGIGASLTPSRANGLYSIHMHMKKRALQAILESNS